MFVHNALRDLLDAIDVAGAHSSRVAPPSPCPICKAAHRARWELENDGGMKNYEDDFPEVK